MILNYHIFFFTPSCHDVSIILNINILNINILIKILNINILINVLKY